MDKSIGIIGLGFVGDALKNGFEYFGVTNIAVHDPKILGSTISRVIDKDIIFICVPTPMCKGGAIDDSIVQNVLRELETEHYSGVAVIKSTLLPTSVCKFRKWFPTLRIVTNPEFLTERRAREDFINTEWILLGGDKDDISLLKELYLFVYRNAPQDIMYAEVTAESAMMAKYMTNVWFSVKVSLMNEYHQLWNILTDKDMVSGDWDDIVRAFSLDSRVGPTHLQVPGPDGDFGFGGKCLVGDEVVHAKLDNCMPNLYYFRDLFDLQDDHKISVASYNRFSAAVEFKPIEGVRKRVVNQLLMIKTDKGSRVTSSIDHNHLVFNPESRTFEKVKVSDLKIGDYVASVNVPISRDKITSTINLLPYEKVKWVKINRNITDDEIQFLYGNDIISRDQKTRLLNGDRSLISKQACIALRINQSDVVKIKTNTSSEFDELITIDDDYAKIVGYYLAGGNITIDDRGNPLTYFSFGFHKDYYINDLCESLSCKGYEYYHKIDKYYNHDSSVVVVKNSVLGYILGKLGCGINSKNKKIPDCIFNDSHLIRVCLSSYFRGDGTVKNGYGKHIGLNIASQSKILIEQINSILRNIKVFASYCQKTGKKSSGISHQLNINCKDDIIAVSNYLNLIEQERNYFIRDKSNNMQDGGSGYTHYIELDHYTLVRVIEILLIDDPTEVYSTQVEDNENFITSGNLLTANCFPKDLNALMSLAKGNGSSAKVMAAAWNDNANYRKNKDWLTIDGAVSEDYVEET